MPGKIETMLCVESASTKSNSVNKLTEHPASVQTSTAKPTVMIQSWWRMASAQKFYQQHLRPVHKLSFAIALLIRILVIGYLSVILKEVLDVTLLTSDNVEAASPAKSIRVLERSVLRELMTKNLAGLAIIVTSRYLITCDCTKNKTKPCSHESQTFLIVVRAYHKK